MPSLAEALEHAAGLYRAGQWAGAERLCTSILQLHPQQLDAITLLGIIAAQTQQAPQALELFGRLVTTRPDDPSAHNNYGIRPLTRHGNLHPPARTVAGAQGRNSRDSSRRHCLTGSGSRHLLRTCQHSLKTEQ